jgi:hypothetical protein
VARLSQDERQRLIADFLDAARLYTIGDLARRTG